MDVSPHGRNGSMSLFQTMHLLSALFCLAFFLSSCGSIGQASVGPLSSPTAIASAKTGFAASTDFLLSRSLNFSSASGARLLNGNTSQFDPATVKSSVVNTFKHIVFVVDDRENVLVYTNSAPQPINAQVSKKADGSVTILYRHSSSLSSSIGSGSTFNGTLTGSQMKATYTANTLTGTTIDGKTFSAATTLAATFATQVLWIAPKQFPSSPKNGQYQLTSDGGVSLHWQATGASMGSVAGYDVYRFVLTDSQGFKLLTKTRATSYVDESPVAKSNAQTAIGISYAIYAVGSTGLENPTGVTISLSSLG